SRTCGYPRPTADGTSEVKGDGDAEPENTGRQGSSGRAVPGTRDPAVTSITVLDSAKLRHPARMLVAGNGMVPWCLYPMLLERVAMDFRTLTIVDASPGTEARIDKRLIAAGARFVCREITAGNAAATVDEFAGDGGTVIQLTTGVHSAFFADVCAQFGDGTP